MPAPKVFSGTNPEEGDEEMYDFLTAEDTGAASYADMIRDHESFAVNDATLDDVLTFPDTGTSRVRDKSSYNEAVEDGFVVHESTRRLEGEHLTYLGEGRTSIDVDYAGSDGPLTFDDARGTYSRFTICAPANESESAVYVDFNKRTPALRFDRIASQPGARLLRAVPRHPRPNRGLHTLI